MNPFSSQTEPIQFVFRNNAPIVALQYTWLPADKRRPYPIVDIQRDFLYYFYAFTFSADISVLDYQGAIDIVAIAAAPDGYTIPKFSLYLEGASTAPILRQPLGLPSFYSDVDYRKYMKPRTASSTGSFNNTIKQLTGEQVNNLKGSFEGVLNQTPNLIGKQSINLIMTFFAQEITSDEQKELLMGNRGIK